MNRWRFPLALLSMLLFFPGVSSGRIGESAREIEGRLKQSRQGLEISGSDLRDFHWSRVPVRGWVQPVQGEVEWFLFYKRFDDSILPATNHLYGDKNGRRGGPVTSPEGWLLHVIEYRGQSVLEYYERSGPISTFERNGLLEAQGEGVEWVEGSPPEGGNLHQPTVLGVTHYRKDGKVYANFAGATALFYRPELDSMIAEVAKRRQMEMAPGSVQGF